jgi:hypothetical protein
MRLLFFLKFFLKLSIMICFMSPPFFDASPIFSFYRNEIKSGEFFDGNVIHHFTSIPRGRHVTSRLNLRGGSKEHGSQGMSDLVLAFWEGQVPLLMKHLQNVLKTLDKVLAQATNTIRGLQSGMEAQAKLASHAFECIDMIQHGNGSEIELKAAVLAALDANRRLQGALVMNLCSMLLVLRKARAVKESMAVITSLTDGGVLEELQDHVASLPQRSVRLNLPPPPPSRKLDPVPSSHSVQHMRQSMEPQHVLCIHFHKAGCLPLLS